jgi:hypothetical protein
MQTLTTEGVLSRSIRMIALAAVVLTASVGLGAAQTRNRSPANPPSQQTGPGQSPCSSVEDCTDQQFDNSGTEGREDLGADAAHPEGPGNDSENN